MPIRPIAICVFRNNGRIFVFEGHDDVKGETFYRPFGGGIDFGELSADAAVREIREEVGAEIHNLRHLATTENIFTHQGDNHHEIVFIYEADFTDQSLYLNEHIDAYESDGTKLKAQWMPLDAFTGGNAPPLYPEGLLKLLSE